MELARPLDAPTEQRSVLAALRMRRKLSVEEAAKRAALWPDQVEWLEEGRLSRFPTSEAAVLALIRYATWLGIDHREARRLSGLPVEPPRRKQLARWLAAGGAVGLVAILLGVLALAFGKSGRRKRAVRPQPCLHPGA